MYELIRFLASSPGRITSIGGGAALILLGILVLQGTAGWAIAAAGLIGCATGALDICILGPVAGLPFSGSKIRHSMR